MSAILSADDLNDFISPSVACIKPVEALPSQIATSDPSNPYEVTTEDALAATNPPPASISLTDCLACSGCVTSAEAILVSLQSYQEVLSTLDAYAELPLPRTAEEAQDGGWWRDLARMDGKIFVATVSPQARASIAATYNVSDKVAGNMIQQLLSGQDGLRSGGAQGSGFAWVLDSNVFREIALESAVEEVETVVAQKQAKRSLMAVSTSGDFTQLDSKPTKPVLTSACPGWICYAEKTHPHVLPHISKIKSPQAIAGTLIKSVLSRKYGIPPDKVWHMAVMPCFDKKLEASREELMEPYWSSPTSTAGISTRGIRDVDLVITSRELLSLAEARGISIADLSRRPIPRAHRTPFPDPKLDAMLFPRSNRLSSDKDAGSSGGYLWHILRSTQAAHPGSKINVQRGRNSDVVEYAVVDAPRHTETSTETNGDALLRAARYYGFRNIQNLVRRLKPAKQSRMPGAARGAVRRPGASRAASVAGAAEVGIEGYDYVEVMACPGGCTNGGGQVKAEDVLALRGVEAGTEGQAVKGLQKEWLARVDEAYFSMDSDADEDEDQEGNMVMADDQDEDDIVIDGVSRRHIKGFVQHWVDCTGIERDRLVCTTYRQVVSDVGKTGTEVERVAGLASSIGGGW